MNKFLTTTFTVLALTQVSAFAGKCEDKLVATSSAIANFRFLQQQAGGVPALADCKEVHHKDPQTGQVTDQIVFLTADRSSLLVHRMAAGFNQPATLTLSPIAGGIRDLAVMAGRLIIVTNEDRLIVVARNGAIFELLNKDKESISAKEVKVDPKTQDLVVTTKDGSFNWNEEQIDKKLNRSDLNRAIAF